MKRMQILSAILAALLVLLTFASCGSGNSDRKPADETETVPQSVQVDETGATVITFDGDTASVSGKGATADGADVLIRSGGTYTVRGSTADGGIAVDAGDADVTLILDGVQIENHRTGAIRVGAKSATVFVKEGTQNALTDMGSTETSEDPRACLYAQSDLILAGSGTLKIKGTAKGIKAGKNITVLGGSYTLDCEDDAVHASGDITVRDGKLTASSGDDAIHADDRVTIGGGEINVTAHEGIEGTRITIGGGKISIRASDDGINAAHKTDDVPPVVEINGGEIDIEMELGGTDGIDANGDIIINGGTVRVTAQNPFDFDGKGELNGGKVFANGTQVTKLMNLSGGEG